MTEAKVTVHSDICQIWKKDFIFCIQRMLFLEKEFIYIYIYETDYRSYILAMALNSAALKRRNFIR